MIKQDKTISLATMNLGQLSNLGLAKASHPSHGTIKSDAGNEFNDVYLANLFAPPTDEHPLAKKNTKSDEDSLHHLEAWSDLSNMELKDLMESAGLSDLARDLEDSYSDSKASLNKNMNEAEGGPSTEQVIDDVEALLQKMSGGIPTELSEFYTDDNTADMSIYSAAKDLIEAIAESETTPAVAMPAPSPVGGVKDNFVSIATEADSGPSSGYAAALLPATKNMKEESKIVLPGIRQQDLVYHNSVTIKKDEESVKSNNSGSNPDAILNALLTGSVAQDCNLGLSSDALKNAVTSTVMGNNGEQIVIIVTQPASNNNGPAWTSTVEEQQLSDDSGIAAPSPAPSVKSEASYSAASHPPASPLAFYDNTTSSTTNYYSVPSPSAGSITSGVTDSLDIGEEACSGFSDGDSDWLPSPRQAPLPARGKRKTVSSSSGGDENNAPVKKYQRKNPRVPEYMFQPYPEDKTERKKAQNKTAAYRYRQKKIAEQEAAESELSTLVSRNQMLKDKLSTVVNEIKCMKKLLKETGLDHIADAIKY